MTRIILLLGFLLLCSSCVGPYPIEEHTLARAAIQAAKEKNADRYAPGLWFKAEQTYKRAERQARNQEHDDAKSTFMRAKRLAERAEVTARVKKFQSGDTFP